MTHLVRVRVEDVSAQFERARAHDARVVEPPTDREYGERDCTLRNLSSVGRHAICPASLEPVPGLDAHAAKTGGAKPEGRRSGSIDVA